MIGMVRLGDEEELHPIDRAGFRAGGIGFVVVLVGPQPERTTVGIEVYAADGMLAVRASDLVLEVPRVDRFGSYTLTVDLQVHDLGRTAIEGCR